MFVYTPLWETLQTRGISTYVLRDTYGIDSKTIRRLRHNQNVTVETLDKLCHILQCDFSQLVQHLPSDQTGCQ